VLEPARHHQRLGFRRRRHGRQRAAAGKGRLAHRIAALGRQQCAADALCRVVAGGISTSGDLFQRLEINGVRYSHIIDPRTGVGLTDHSLVTVIAPDDFTADGLTKVMSVLDPKDALKFIAKTPDAAVRIVRKPGDKIEAYESKGSASIMNDRRMQLNLAISIHCAIMPPSMKMKMKLAMTLSAFGLLLAGFPAAAQNPRPRKQMGHQQNRCQQTSARFG
jgi:hypothetical protein